MPVIARNDDKVLFADILGLVKRQLGDLLLHLLAFAIAAVEKLRQSLGFLWGVGFKKFDHVTGDVHPPGGVDPRSNAKADMIAGHFVSTFRNLHKSTKSGIPGLWQIFYTNAHDV